MQAEVTRQKWWFSVISFAWYPVVYTKPKLCSWAFGRILHTILHSFLNTILLYYPYPQSENIWSQTHRKWESIYFIVIWHFMNSPCSCSHACLLPNNENLFCWQYIKPSLVYSFYSHDHIVKKPNDIWFFSTLV